LEGHFEIAHEAPGEDLMRYVITSHLAEFNDEFDALSCKPGLFEMLKWLVCCRRNMLGIVHLSSQEK